MVNLEAGAAFDRYTIEGLLGVGGTATVYRARHVQLGTWHAIKVLEASSPRVRGRLLHEARLQASLRHPNIVSVTDVIEVDGRPAVVMEAVDGLALDELLLAARLTAPQVDALVAGILDGVAHAHRLGLVHRDLKPANILLRPFDGGVVPMITDFGIAKVLGAAGVKTTRTGAVMGTPGYMSPEQIADTSRVDQRTDVFALGAILYEMLTGRPTFPQEQVYACWRAITHGDFVRLDEIDPTLPKRMITAVHAALEVDASKRVPDVPALAALWFDRAHEPAQPSAPAAEYPVELWSTDRLALISRPPSRPSEPRPVRERDTMAPPLPRPVDPTRRRLPLLRLALFGTVSTLGLAGLGALGALGLWGASQLTGVAGEPPPPSAVEVASTVEAPPPAPAPAPVEVAPPAAVPAPTPEPPAAESTVAKPKTPPHPKAPPAPDPVAPAAPKTGRLVVRSVPEAKISLDAVEAGSTADFGRDVAPGMHRVVLSTADHRMYATSVVVQVDGTASLCWDFDLARSCR